MKVRYMKSIIEPFRLNGWNTADTTPTHPPTHPNQLNPLKSTNDECFFFLIWRQFTSIPKRSVFEMIPFTRFFKP